MDSFDKNINKIFNSIPNDSMPTGYEWGGMEQGIMDKMPDKKPSRKPFIFWILGGAALFLLFGLYNYTNHNITHKKSTSKLLINSTEEASEKNNAIDQNNLLPKSQETTNLLEQKRVTTDVEKSNSKTSNAKNVFQAKPKTILSKPQNVFHQAPSKIGGFPRNADNKDSFDKIRKTKDVKRDLRDKTKSFASDNTGPKQKRSQFSEVHFLPTLLKPIRCYSKVPVFISPKINYFADAQKAKKLEKPSLTEPFTLKASSGINIWSAHHKNATFMDTYTHKQPGYFVDLGLAYDVNPKWYVELGYNHQKLISLFEFKKNDFTDYTYQDVVLNVNTNSLSGQIIQTVGDTTVSAPRYRDVTYYNVSKLHSVKLSLGRRVHLARKLKIDVNSGLSYLFGLESDGYNVDSQEELVYFNSSDNIYKSNQLALGLKVNVTYNLFSKLELTLGLSTDKYLSNWSAHDNFEYRPFIVNISGGLQYKF